MSESRNSFLLVYTQSSLVEQTGNAAIGIFDVEAQNYGSLTPHVLVRILHFWGETSTGDHQIISAFKQVLPGPGFPLL